MGFVVERSANSATENKLYTQSYEIFGVIWGAIGCNSINLVPRAFSPPPTPPLTKGKGPGNEVAIVYANWLSERAELESILLSVLSSYEPSTATCVCHDQERNIFRAARLKSTNKYFII